MKKVFVVSKTHLDLGFTDYAENIRQKYINSFIPDAISLAEKVNTADKKSFIWTTGSWLLLETLACSDDAGRERLFNAIKNGNIAPHAMPFTTHTELMDYDTLNYGLSMVEELDKIRGRKTVAAKMTDVPGHTQALVKLLAEHGIKLLHIGVNGASAVPEVPECFLWKCGDSEVVVVYSGDYGGAFKSDIFDEVLYFDHTLDNHGAPSPEKVLEKLGRIQSEFPGYEVTAATLDDFADVVWEYKDRLPVIDGEIGDTWIHGSAADPYKSASLRELMRLKREWLADGTMTRDSEEYKKFTVALLCIAEHTCGMDSKMYLADYENYIKKDFQSAKRQDTVRVRHPFRDFPHNFVSFFNNLKGDTNHAYSVIEKSWAEQRAYINKAVSALSEQHREQAEEVLKSLCPESIVDVAGYHHYNSSVVFGDFEFSLNEFGGIGVLKFRGNEIIKKNSRPFLEFRGYTSKDYDFWFKHYSRNLLKNGGWAIPDFGKPSLKCFDGKYPGGRFFYKMTEAYVKKSDSCIKVAVSLKCDKVICEESGASRDVQVVYTLSENGVKFDVVCCNKDENRLPEAMFVHLYPCDGDFKLIKIGSEIDYKSVVSMGGKNLHAVEKSVLKTEFGDFDFVNRLSPLISIGRGKILEYDNKIEDINRDGISYVLCDNVWGTNFPLWYGDNALYSFEIVKNTIR